MIYHTGLQIDCRDKTAAHGHGNSISNGHGTAAMWSSLHDVTWLLLHVTLHSTNLLILQNLFQIHLENINFVLIQALYHHK